MFLNNYDWIWSLLFSTKVAVSHDRPSDGVSTMTPTVVLIHGANATSLTFAHIRSCLPNYNYINIDYSPYGGFYNNLDEMVNKIKDVGPVYIVGHSFGGIYAMHLAQQVSAIGGSTVATPFGGSKHARWAKLLAPSYLIFQEVGCKSKPILEAQSFGLNGDWINLVGEAGSVPWIAGGNDGVLTHESMTCRSDMTTRFINSNHSEIVCHADAVAAIGNHIDLITKKLIDNAA
jgi:hypothetical protein